MQRHVGRAAARPAVSPVGAPVSAAGTLPEERPRDRRWVRFFREDVVVVQGAHWDRLLEVGWGLLQLSAVARSGKRAVVGVLGPGDVLVPAVETGGQPMAPWTVTALTAGELRTTAAEDLGAWLEAVPGLAARWHALAFRTRQMEDRLMRTLSGGARARVAGALLDLAGRFGSGLARGTTVGVPFSQGDLAAMAGVARETLNRLLATFREAGWLALSPETGSVVVVDEAALRAAAEGNG